MVGYYVGLEMGLLNVKYYFFFKVWVVIYDCFDFGVKLVIYWILESIVWILMCVLVMDCDSVLFVC